MEGWLLDLRRAVRAVARRPGGAAVVVVTMAVGIGACVAMRAYVAYFASFVPEAPAPERLAWLFHATEEEPRGWLSYPDWRDLEVADTGLARHAAFRILGASVELPETTLWGWGFAVSGEYFELFGARPQIGRLLRPEDDRPGAPPVVVLSDAYWRRGFGADPGVVGRVVELDGRLPYTVVGVAPRGFQGQGFALSLYLPLAGAAPFFTDHEDRDAARLQVLAGLAPGTSAAEAATRLAAVAASLDAAHPREEARRFTVLPAAEHSPYAEDDPMLGGARALATSVAFLLVLACANVANLMLARATARRRELAVELALGAPRGRVGRQLVLESLVLSAAGGVLGLALVRPILAVLEEYLLRSTPVGFGDWGHGSHLAVDPAGVATTLAVLVVGAGLLAALPPLVATFRTDLVTALKDDRLRTPFGSKRLLGPPASRRPPGATKDDRRRTPFGSKRLLGPPASRRPPGATKDDRRRTPFGSKRLLGPPASRRPPGATVRRWRRPGPQQLLVVAQVALSVVLLVGTGLLARSLGRALATDPGFRGHGLTVAAVYVPTDRGADLEPGRAVYRDLLAGARELPGVASATLVQRIPLSDFSRPVEAELPDLGASGAIDAELVGDGFFATMGVPVLQGRGIEARDRVDAPPVVVVSRGAAERWFPGGDALGRRVVVRDGEGEPGTAYEVVGVVADVRGKGLTAAPEPTLYFSWEQRFHPRLALLLRTTAPVDRALRALVHARHPEVAIVDLVPFAEQVDRTTALRRQVRDVAAAFGVLGLALAALGLYGVASHGVARRVREMGIRAALGATGRDLERLVLRETLRLTAAGIATGLAVAWPAARLLESQLYGVTPHDAATYLTVPLLLAATTTLATLPPAHRAARVDPMTALRDG